MLPIKAAEADEIRSIHSSFHEAIPAPPDIFTGRGIVLVVGRTGAESEYVATTIGMIRLLESRLPIELWFADEGIIIESGWCQKLVFAGVTCRSISKYVHDAASRKVFPHDDQYRTVAMIFSAFEEVLYLDSTTFPVINPDDLFGSAEYQRTGAIFWQDFWQSSETTWAAYSTGLSDKAAEQHLAKSATLDGAQILWNKKKHWKVMLEINSMAYFAHTRTRL